jgi:hypothetical protein
MYVMNQIELIFRLLQTSQCNLATGCLKKSEKAYLAPLGGNADFCLMNLIM